jgi:hypothetical protein
MRTYSILIFITTILIVSFQACQPGTMVKKTEEVQVDSALYFQQVEVVDPFIDSVFSPAGQTGSLSMKLIPPPPPEPEIPRFKEIEGFRVQIFAGIDSINAVPVLRQACQVSTDSVYLFKESGLFKIQVGDFVYRYQADSCNMSVRKNGFPGAWVVKRMVLIPFIPEISTMPDSSEIDVQLEDSINEPAGGRYKIQLIATSTSERADLIVKDLKENQKYPAFFEKVGTLYKVYVGPFVNETDARKALDSVRRSGYPDAWLVY